jgi:hypothetical protein
MFVLFWYSWAICRASTVLSFGSSPVARLRYGGASRVSSLLLSLLGTFFKLSRGPFTSAVLLPCSWLVGLCDVLFVKHAPSLWTCMLCRASSTSPNPPFRHPYLACVHSDALTCLFRCAGHLHDALWSRLREQRFGGGVSCHPQRLHRHVQRHHVRCLLIFCGELRPLVCFECVEVRSVAHIVLALGLWCNVARFASGLLESVSEGLCDQADITAALTHVFKLRFQLGLFDPVESQPLWHVPLSTVNTTASQALNLLATQSSMVLLQVCLLVGPLLCLLLRFLCALLLGRCLVDCEPAAASRTNPRRRALFWPAEQGRALASEEGLLGGRHWSALPQQRRPGRQL